MATQHGHDNIRVDCVFPGMAYTPMVRMIEMSDRLRQARVEMSVLKQEGYG